MQSKIQKTTLLFFFAIFCSFCENLLGDLECHVLSTKNIEQPTKESLKQYFLPQHSPLYNYLKNLFTDPNMFHSTENFKKEGFKVKMGHKQLMVGYHSSVPQILFKKFPDSRPQSKQLSNYLKRIDGANILRKYIQEHNFKHLAVPQKWLYPLPKSYAKGTRSYILIVENMDILSKEENGKLYYNMDKEVLKELCTILHDVGGCDAFPRNQPFTRSGKIAFVDTEHVGHMKNHFLKHIIPSLNKDLQSYAEALWTELEHNNRAKVLQ